MSEARDTRMVSHGPQETVNLAIAAAVRMDYGPERLGSGYVKLKRRSVRERLLKQDKGTIEVQARDAGSATEVTFRCANLGIGPINTGIVRKNLQRFVAEFEAELARAAAPAARRTAMPGGGGGPQPRGAGGGGGVA
jgi:hypothetical protein